jgi:5-(carboxyamino)imidazole ribonucleotide mutase
MSAQVGIIMGSESDLKVMSEAADILRELGVAFELTVVSAHRTPGRMVEYARTAAERGVKVVIAGAGGAAHLPGMVASLTILPVIGVPIKSSNSIDGWDSVLSILQMPSGVPVATVALDGARNAGILAAQILAISDPALAKKLTDFKKKLSEKVEASIRELKIAGYSNGFDQ